MAKAILFDATKCTGCRGCQTACKQWNGLPADWEPGELNRGTYENPKDLSEKTWLKMRFNEVGDVSNGDMAWLFSRYACMHCGDAACINVCPTGALYRHEQGMVLYDRDLCSGCGYCVEACPFSVPRMEEGWSKLTGKGKVAQKCTMCVDRITATTGAVPEVDRIPACVKTCPTGALQFGDRDEMVNLGNIRLRELAIPGRDVRLYGETECGGTNVMFILDRNAEDYLLPKDPKVSGITTAWKKYLQPIGYGVVGLVAAGLVVNYMASRARMLKEKEGE